MGEFVLARPFRGVHGRTCVACALGGSHTQCAFSKLRLSRNLIESVQNFPGLAMNIVDIS